MSEPTLGHRFRTLFPRLTLLAALTGALTRAGERALRPGLRAWRGAANGLWLVTLILAASMFFYGALLPMPSFGRVLAVSGRVLQAFAAGVGVVVAAWALAKMPSRFRWAFAVCGTVLIAVFGRLGDNGGWAVVYVVVAASLAGAGWRVTSRGGMRQLGPLKRALAAFGVVAGVGALAWAAAWVAGDGMDAVDIRNAAIEAAASIAPLELADPGAPGPYEVLALTYGSGDDHRHEYGRDADLLTEPVDGSAFVEDWNDWRTDFWGFDDDEMPLQGRVWYPSGGGPFALVLIVHGNHSMEEYSDPGYAYLGELLASRGVIVVSVDENFLNGSAVGGLRQENDARGWLLLEHLRQWQQWNEQADHVFGGKVDTSRLALIGHSRGGEAVAVAAAFNRLTNYPDDATVAFDYGFHIGAVIAIAPVYGQYQPGGRLTRLTDVNYMSIHGANDGDVTQFDGARQFQNVVFSGEDYRFKATAYVFGANHGQFNTVWGNNDWGMPFGRMLNRRALLAGEQQRQAGKVFISAFLEASLNGRTEYLELFVDPRRARAWLPETIYITDFSDSRSRVLADFDEDVDVTTATIDGGTTRGENLSVWREDRLRFKYRDKETSAAYIGWFEHERSESAETGEADSGDQVPSPVGPARYVIDLPETFDAAGAHELFLAITDADESPEPERDDEDDDQAREADQQAPHEQQRDANPASNDEDKREGAGDEDEPREPLDFTLRLTDVAGNSAALPLSRFSLVQPQLQVQLRKGLFGSPEKDSEAIPQRFAYPLIWFVDANPEFDPTALRRIELVFDRSPEGVIALERVGLR